jgi:plasmid rolling circle replication initiator protein Rep
LADIEKKLKKGEKITLFEQTQLDDFQKKLGIYETQNNLTAYERQLIDEMDTKSRLTTINEEKSKFKGFRNNRLAPIDGIFYFLMYSISIE